MTDVDRVGGSSESPTAKSLALLDAITSSATVGFGFVDRDYRIVRLNAMLAAIVGGTLEEQIGRTVAEAVPHLWPEMEGVVRQVLESGEDVVNHELIGASAAADADRHWLASFHAVRGTGGEIIGVAAIVFDITERWLAERFSQQLIETSNAIVLVLDTEANIVDFNRAGSTRSTMAGQHDLDQMMFMRPTPTLSRYATPGTSDWGAVKEPHLNISGVGGTLSGNALAMAAIRATLQHTLTDSDYEHTIDLASRWTAGVQREIDLADLGWSVTQLGCRAEYWLCPAPRTAADAASAADEDVEAFLHLHALNRGVLLTPFHNMALMCRDTTLDDVNRHTVVFAEALHDLLSDA